MRSNEIYHDSDFILHLGEHNYMKEKKKYNKQIPLLPVQFLSDLGRVLGPFSSLFWFYVLTLNSFI